MNFFDICQLIAGCIAVFGCLPQIIQTYKTKSVSDFNLSTYLAGFIATLLMELYAINLVINGSGLMLLLTNTFCLLTSGSMVYMIIKYR